MGDARCDSRLRLVLELLSPPTMLDLFRNLFTHGPDEE